MFALLAQAADKADVAEKAADVAEKAAPVAASGWVIFSLMLAVVFVPYILGSVIGNVLRLKDFNSRIGTVLFMVAVCLTPFGYRLYNADADLTFGERFAECFRLGIDLDGGTNLVYEIDQEKAAEKAMARTMMPHLPKVVSQVEAEDLPLHSAQLMPMLWMKP